MSLVFKLTIPDGTLAEYLSTMSSKARNFEIVRLATNDLIRMQQPQPKHEEGISYEESARYQNESKKPDVAYASPYNGMQNNTEQLSEKDNSNETENETESLDSNRVDFGSELLDMN